MKHLHNITYFSSAPRSSRLSTKPALTLTTHPSLSPLLSIPCLLSTTIVPSLLPSLPPLLPLHHSSPYPSIPLSSLLLLPSSTISTNPSQISHPPSLVPLLPIPSSPLSTTLAPPSPPTHLYYLCSHLCSTSFLPHLPSFPLYHPCSSFPHCLYHLCSPSLLPPL